MFEDILEDNKKEKEKEKEDKEKWPWYDPTIYFYLVRERVRVDRHGNNVVDMKLLSKVIGSDKDIFIPELSF